VRDGGRPIEVGDDDVRPLRREALGRHLADPARGADDDDDLAGEELRGALLGDLLLDLPALERPVLELEDVALGDEREAA
jgi:hypothetical protein